MRQTLLNFRSPNEVTPEFRMVTVTYKGTNLEYNQRDQSDPNRYANSELQTYHELKNRPKSIVSNTQSNFGKDQRFREAPLYCKGSGQSIYTGPGSYNDHEKFAKIKTKPCSTLMKNSSYLPKEESKKQCYIMIGH